MRQRTREEHIYFAENAPIYLSVTVAAALGERVELMGSGEVLALVSAPEGRYRVTRKANSEAGLINARGMAQYLLRRFPLCGGRLAAWVDRAHGAVLFGPGAHREKGLDGSFQTIELESISAHIKYQVRQDRLTVSLALPARMSAWVRDGVVALVRDRQGPYRREREGGETFLRSKALADYCRGLWGEKTPFSRTMEEGVALSPDFLALTELDGLEGFRRLELQEDRERTATLRRDRSILLSQEAARTLGRAASVYACGGVLALRPDRQGDVLIRRTEGGGVVHSHRLYQQAAMGHPGVETFRLVAHGDLWVLSPGEEELWPPADCFCRRLVENAVLV